MSFRYYIFVFFTFIAFNGFTQDTTIIKKWKVTKAGKPEVKPAGIQYFFRKFDMEQGIGNPYILRIRENKKGEILFGTSGNGAGIFNGYIFKFFNLSNGLKNNIVQDVFEDNLGKLWIATSGGGVSVFDGNSFKNFDKSNGLPDNSVWIIFQDSKNQIWFGTENGGVCCYNGKTFQIFSKKDGLCSQNIREIFEDKHGNLWFGSNTEGLSIYDGKSFKNYNTKNGLTCNGVLGIDEDYEGKIWIATYGGGLISFKNETFNYYGKVQGLSNLNTCDVLCDSKNNIWIATSGSGIFLYNGKEFKPFSVNEGLSNNIVLSLLEDKYGNIWVATYGGGICQYTAKQFTYLSESEGLPGNVIRSISIKNDTNIVFCSSGGGICFYNGNLFNTYTTTQGLSSNFILSSEFDKSNNLWMASSGGGIMKYDGNNFYNLTTEHGLKTNFFLSILIGNKNEIYAGGYGGGLSIIKNDTIIHYGSKDSLPSIFINSITQDTKHNVWIGTETGLYILTNGKISKLYPDVFSKNTPVISLYCDNKNRIWIGTDGQGLFQLKDKTLLNLKEENGLCNNHIKSILADNTDGIWIGTANGISFLKPKSKNINSLSDYEIQNYSRVEGYTGSTCMANSICIDNNEIIWIGTGRKLLCINPKLKEINNIQPSVIIESIELFYKNINWKNYLDSGLVYFNKLENWTKLPIGLVLPYNLNHFTFCYSGINLNCPEKTKYSFILEGMDHQWSPPTSEKKATYSNLPSGKYTFKVISINENGIKSTEIAQFHFEIETPWWEQIWFRILAFLFLIFIILVIIKLREQKLIKAKVLLENTVNERTAEVVKQRDEILIKNQTLNQQKEEITAQRDEIESQRDEILAQRDLVTIQKEQIEEIHNEISQSIDYATRLQTAILPDINQIKQYISDCFVIYKPKDKVSGDFYWFAKVENNLIITVADCTGHGVPGAFMSMLGSSLLREIVIKEYITQPAIILRRLRKEIINILKQKGESGEQKDGMDMSLITINIDTLDMQFAGANNPIYIIKKSENEELSTSDFSEGMPSAQLYELKGDKMPVAIHERMDSFNNTNIQIKKGDYIYLFSDGFADQFGGPKGKKFMYKQFKELLLSVSQKPMHEQKTIITNSLTNWIGNGEQVDDITLIGIKI
ncbi:MAG: SpoIIE family protein phosphatase [Bacteroidia bacterium]|nr:SpoIIE family protein phosphatase [Bacteroidia bacterium]